MNFRSEVSSCASRPMEVMVWINEIESAKSIADLKTSKTNHPGQVADERRGS